MKVNVINELEKNRKKSQDKADLIVEEVKLLMDTSSQEERKALEIAGLDEHLKHVSNSKGSEIERKEFEEQYGSHVFNTEELKEICMKYDLRMLETRRFIGKVDGEVAIKLKKFMENRGGEMGGYSRDFLIIGPEYAFQLENQPRVPPRQWIDPILVYKIPSEDKYVFIHKWGKDFTLFRRLRGIFFKSVTSMILCTWALWFIITGLITSAIHGEFTGKFTNYLWLILPGAISFGLATLTLLALFNQHTNWWKRTTDYTWNSVYKRRY